jgi:hypothetical protein
MKTILLLTVLAVLTYIIALNTKPIVTNCKVLVLGGGFAGTYSWYQLAQLYGKGVCLVEANDRLGGRIWDVAREPGGPVFGVAALRVTAADKTMIQLAKDLNMNLQVQETDIELLRVRGNYYYRDITSGKSETKKMCKEVFRDISCDTEKDTDVQILTSLVEMYQHNKSIADAYPNFPAYVAGIYGDEGLAFIKDTVRYLSPFESVSVQSLMDFWYREFRDMELDPTRYYPEGGMSQYIFRMKQRAEAAGARLFMHEPVLSIDSEIQNGKEIFIVGTNKRVFKAPNVINAIDPMPFRHMSGSIAETIQSASEFNTLKPMKLAIVTMWWNERWWETSKYYGTRKLSRVVSHENCFSVMDIPTFPYGRDQNVTRAVYDDGACVEMWDMLVNDPDKTKLPRVVIESLQNVFKDVKIPKPHSTHGAVHHNAWHYQYPDSKISNDQVFKWSLQPIPGKNFVMIGEAYNLNFAAWVDGALKSAMWALTTHYGFEYPCLHDWGSPAKCPDEPLLKDEPLDARNSRVLFG